MFQTLARKPTARPQPMRTSGEALSSHSETPLRSASGMTKKASNVATGSWPSAANMAAPTTRVSAAAMTGAAIRIAADGSGRCSILKSNGIPPGAILGKAGHQHADLLAVGPGADKRLGDAALADHQQPVADLEQLVEFLRNKQDRGA